MSAIKHIRQKVLSWLVITVAILGIIPLVFLGITTDSAVAWMAGLADIAFATVIFIEGIRIGMLSDKRD